MTARWRILATTGHGTQVMLAPRADFPEGMDHLDLAPRLIQRIADVKAAGIGTIENR